MGESTSSKHYPSGHDEGSDDRNLFVFYVGNPTKISPQGAPNVDHTVIQMGGSTSSGHYPSGHDEGSDDCNLFVLLVDDPTKRQQVGKVAIPNDGSVTLHAPLDDTIAPTRERVKTIFVQISTNEIWPERDFESLKKEFEDKKYHDVLNGPDPVNFLLIPFYMISWLRYHQNEDVAIVTVAIEVDDVPNTDLPVPFIKSLKKLFGRINSKYIYVPICFMGNDNSAIGHTSPAVFNCPEQTLYYYEPGEMALETKEKYAAYILKLFQVAYPTAKLKFPDQKSCEDKNNCGIRSLQVFKKYPDEEQIAQELKKIDFQQIRRELFEELILFIKDKPCVLQWPLKKD